MQFSNCAHVAESSNVQFQYFTVLTIKTNNTCSCLTLFGFSYRKLLKSLYCGTSRCQKWYLQLNHYKRPMLQILVQKIQRWL